MPDHELPGSGFPAAPPVPLGPTSPSDLAPQAPPPLPGLTPITDSAIRESLKRIHTGYSHKAGLRATTGDGGTVTGFVDWERGPLTATGYSTWRRKTGVEVGGEITYDFDKRD